MSRGNAMAWRIMLKNVLSEVCPAKLKEAIKRAYQEPMDEGTLELLFEEEACVLRLYFELVKEELGIK